MTVEDYFNDFNKIKKPFNQVRHTHAGPGGLGRLSYSEERCFECSCEILQQMTSEALRRVVVEYIKAVMQKRIFFRNADERREGADRMIKEADQFKFLFKKLSAVSGLVCQMDSAQVFSLIAIHLF